MGLKGAAFLALLGLNGCAYLNSGATQDVLINSGDRDSVFVNRHYVGQGDVSVVLLKKNDYVINIRTPSDSSVAEPVKTKFDVPAFLLDFPVFSYGYPVDFGTGSLRSMVDGEHYKLIGGTKGGGELDALNRSEREERGAFKSSIGMTFLFLALGSGVSQFAEFNNPPAVDASIGILSAVFVGGVVYEISRTIHSIKSINRINREKEYK